MAVAGYGLRLGRSRAASAPGPGSSTRPGHPPRRDASPGTPDACGMRGADHRWTHLAGGHRAGGLGELGRGGTVSGLRARRRARPAARPLVAAIALLNRAIFWFHPLAWWLPRTISRLSEQACDAAVIARGYDRDVYMSCLLRFARRVADADGRIAPLSSAMPGAGLAERLGMSRIRRARRRRAHDSPVPSWRVPHCSWFVPRQRQRRGRCRV